MIKAELLCGPLDGQEVEVADPPPQVLLVPYLAQAHTGPGLTWDPEPDPADRLRVPCPVQLLYIRDRDMSRVRYRHHTGGW